MEKPALQGQRETSRAPEESGALQGGLGFGKRPEVSEKFGCRVRVDLAAMHGAEGQTAARWPSIVMPRAGQARVDVLYYA